MREILFRGKRKRNGNWIDGGFCEYRNFSGEDVYNIIHNGYSNEVIPETVGQYTGLTDKNGKKIFEGDIVRVNLPNGFRGIKEVKFANGGFLPYIIQYSSFDWGGENTEVIGNIHDNKLEDFENGC